MAAALWRGPMWAWEGCYVSLSPWGHARRPRRLGGLRPLEEMRWDLARGTRVGGRGRVRGRCVGRRSSRVVGLALGGRRLWRRSCGSGLSGRSLEVEERALGDGRRRGHRAGPVGRDHRPPRPERRRQVDADPDADHAAAADGRHRGRQRLRRRPSGRRRAPLDRRHADRGKACAGRLDLAGRSPRRRQARAVAGDGAHGAAEDHAGRALAARRSGAREARDGGGPGGSGR